MKLPHQYKTVSIGNFSLDYHEYKEYGIKGVGTDGVPIVNMDPYIDHSMDDELHIEVCKGMALSKNYDLGRCNGAIAPFEREKYNADCLAITLSKIEELENSSVHIGALHEIVNKRQHESIHDLHQAVYRYCYYALNSIIPWFYVLYLKKSSFFEKNNDGGTWTNDSKHFPKLLKYIDSLPFKHVGRVKIFTSYPGAGVICHRDGVVQAHRDHSINLFFLGYRPTYVWDEITKKKTFLEKGAKSYFFNNRDFHGVEAESVFRYTVRVDGEFTDELQKELKLDNGYTWRE